MACRAELERATAVWETSAGDLDITERAVKGWDHKIYALRERIGAEEAELKQLQHALQQLRADLEAAEHNVAELRAQLEPDQR